MGKPLMRRTIPCVKDGQLYQSETGSDPIVLGTRAWYDWLEHYATFTFVDRVGTFTARKSMLKTRDSYWKAYSKRQGKLYRIHLGHSHTLTLERLQAAALAFVGEQVPGVESTDVFLNADCCYKALITPNCNQCRQLHVPDADKTLSTTQPQRYDLTRPPHRAPERGIEW